MKKPSRTYLSYGLFIGLLQVAIFIIFYVFGLYLQPEMTWLPTLIFMVLIIIAIIDRSKINQENSGFRDLLIVGLKTTAIGTLIYFLLIVIFILLVPPYIEKLKDISRYMWNRLIISSIAAVFIGAIGSLIGAAIFKRNSRI
jgi:hypothetical protein